MSKIIVWLPRFCRRNAVLTMRNCNCGENWSTWIRWWMCCWHAHCRWRRQCACCSCHGCCESCCASSKASHQHCLDAEYFVAATLPCSFSMVSWIHHCVWCRQCTLLPTSLSSRSSACLPVSPNLWWCPCWRTIPFSSWCPCLMFCLWFLVWVMSWVHLCCWCLSTPCVLCTDIYAMLCLMFLQLSSCCAAVLDDGMRFVCIWFEWWRCLNGIFEFRLCRFGAIVMVKSHCVVGTMCVFCMACLWLAVWTTCLEVKNVVLLTATQIASHGSSKETKLSTQLELLYNSADNDDFATLAIFLDDHSTANTPSFRSS